MTHPIDVGSEAVRSIQTEALAQLGIPPTEAIPTRGLRTIARAALNKEDQDEWLDCRLKLHHASNNELAQEFTTLQKTQKPS